MKKEKYVAYVGTYTHENSVGIHIYDVDVANGSMKERKVVPINNPSDLVVSKDRKFLYSIADEGVEAFKVLPDGDLEAARISTVIAVAPASIAFSTSSFTTEAGRSTTSPAAILSIVF